MSNNKEQIKKLRDYAELAWASYGYFDRLKYNDAQDEDSQKALKEFRKIKDDETAIITYADILDITYKYYLDDNGKPKDSWYHKHFLDGDFSPLQAKQFFERYDLLIHQPNTESGFSATLFGEKRKQIDSKTKKVSYTNKYGYVNYIFAIRGTELKINQAWQDTITADGSLVLNSIPKNQYDDMLLFYHQCIGNIPFYVERDSKEYIESRKVA